MGQVLLIVMIAVLMGMATNTIRPDGIPFVGDWSEQARFADAAGDSLVISIAQAEQLFRQKAALFLDARPRGQYVEGHIREALSLPWQEVNQYFVDMADRLESRKTIITYCDGENCELSHDLALFLKEMGFENVRVLVNGWTVWQQADLPSDMGE